MKLVENLVQWLDFVLFILNLRVPLPYFWLFLLSYSSLECYKVLGP
jgi:hypothetical protein